MVPVEMKPESGSTPEESRSSSWKSYRGTILLAYQSFGVVYGDLTISPMYVYKSTFSGKLRIHEEDAEVLGVLSLVFWTLTLLAVCKYIIIVLGADDNGEGGIFALYSLMCRNSKAGLINAHRASDKQSTASEILSTPSNETITSSLLNSFFEKHQTSRRVLLLMVLLGTSMVVGDGVLMPAMSVLSAVSGLRIKIPELHENYTILLSCIILMALFALQQYGTHRVGFMFAPIMIAWLGCISGVGIYNIFKWNTDVVHAVSPYYIYNFFKKAGRDGWSSLGGIFLCVTGTEAMFADLGHFSKLSIRMAFIGVVYPCLVLAYMGEAAYLSKHKEHLQRSFYKAIPDKVFWPVLIIATLATVVASQAIISATFSLISQCRAFSCFPRVKITHTSNHIRGQIYIPEVNWIMMVLCLGLVIGFRDTDAIGNAYGLSVITVMLVTTCLMFLVLTTVWSKSLFFAFLLTTIYGSLELVYFTACAVKYRHGGWLPFLLSLVILTTMAAWHYGTEKKLEFEVQNTVSFDSLLALGSGLDLVRVPGIALVYTDIPAADAPPMFAHFVTNFSAFHRVLVFVSIQTYTIPEVPEHEKFSIERIGLREQCIFRCIVRYGYKDGGRYRNADFENRLLDKVAEFLQREHKELAPNGRDVGLRKRVRFAEDSNNSNEELKAFEEERQMGVTYMIGNTKLTAGDTSPWVKKVAIDGVYGFFRRNSRWPAVSLSVPQASLIEVGMVYVV